MGTDVKSNDKRIAKNTLLLYFRQFLILAVTLYTSRVILQTLGVEDYGIYNVVGGVVSMMGMLNASMSVATQRYLTYELGRGDKERLKMTFSTSFYIYLILGAILVVLAETVGVWFVNTHLVIPEDRIVAANWVFQLSILASINTLLVNPFNACIIAHEKMGVYAYVSILDVSLKLAVAYALLASPFDRLITYGTLILISQLIITMIYRVYCIKHFEECHLVLKKDNEMFKQILSFSGWNLFGSVASLFKTQGLNIVINMFFAPAVNASRGIAVQINHAVTQFTSNFYTAFRPQITKYCAQGDYHNMIRLVNKSSIYSYYLIMLITMPILIETPAIIQLWLGQTPDYVVSFTRLIIIITAVDSMAHPLMTVAQAVGNMKLYQSVLAPIILLNVPFSYIALKLGAEPTAVFYISVTLSTVCLIARVFLVRHLVKFPAYEYFKNVYLKGFLVTIISAMLPLIVKYFSNESGLSSIVILASCVLSSIVVIYLIGIGQEERTFVKQFIKKKIKR